MEYIPVTKRYVLLDKASGFHVHPLSRADNLAIQRPEFCVMTDQRPPRVGGDLMVVDTKVIKQSMIGGRS